MARAFVLGDDHTGDIHAATQVIGKRLGTHTGARGQAETWLPSEMTGGKMIWLQRATGRTLLEQSAPEKPTLQHGS